jgi:hypothetical protein
MATKELLVGRGSGMAAKLTNGVPGAFLQFGNLKSYAFALQIEKGEHYETETTQSLLIASWQNKKGGSVEAEFEELNSNNAKLLFSARVNDVAASTATAEVIATAVPSVGDVLVLKRGLVSSVVIKDSTSGTPKTLVAGTNYRLRDSGMFGSIDVLDVSSGGTFTPPLKADYSYGAQTRATLLTADDDEYALRFEGISKATNRRFLLEFWRAKFSPADKADFIGNEVTAMKSTISLLADTSKSATDEFGQFGRLTWLGAA